MAHFRVHEYNQAYMARLGLHSYNQCKSNLLMFRRIFPYYTAIVATFAFQSSFMFLYKNSHEVKEALESLKIVAGGFQSATCFFVVGFQLKTITLLHSKLQEIVNECDNNEIYVSYWNTEQKCRKYTLRIGLYVILHTLEFGVLIVYVLVCMIVGIRNPASWPLFFKLYLPFDEYQNMLNWFIAWFLEFNLSFAYSIAMTSVTSYFVSCSIYIQGMCEHFNLLMQFMNRQTAQNHSGCKNKLQAIQVLTEAIQIHVKTIEISRLVSTIFSGPIFALLPANAIFMAVSMFDAEQTVSHFEALVFMFDMSCIISALLWPLFFCYFANATTVKIASIGNAAYSSNWHDLPIKLHKYIQLVIVRSQYPVYFTGLGIVRCTLEVFGHLLKTSCSYYMLYRTFAGR